MAVTGLAGEHRDKSQEYEFPMLFGNSADFGFCFFPGAIDFDPLMVQTVLFDNKGTVVYDSRGHYAFVIE